MKKDVSSIRKRALSSDGKLDIDKVIILSLKKTKKRNDCLCCHAKYEQRWYKRLTLKT